MKTYIYNKVQGIAKVFLPLCLLASMMVFTACDDLLDELPDNRTEIDTPTKVRLLLVSGYPQSVPAVICELSGDNLVDNNVVKPATHRDAYALFQDEAYKWEDIMNYGTGEDDTPYQVWESYYQGIAVANHAIEAMKKMTEDPANDPDLAHSWGEAHVLRAYLHFILVNVFAEAYKDEAQSKLDRGIPYVVKPETQVNVDYSDSEYLHSVAETYDLIEKDILEGIDLIDDSKYQVPAYHFNHNAANAFAARFYLFKRDYEKVLKYANEALGGNAASMMRKWGSISTNTINSMLNSYNDESAPCNFLLQSAYSLQDRMLSAIRFVINDGKTVTINGTDYTVPSTKDVIYGGGPNWSNRLPAYDGKIYRFGQNDDGSWLFRVYEYFEYSDKIAGIGWVHIIYQPFTAEETLLCRAEAELYLNKTAEALQDLNIWTASKQVGAALTQANVNRFYAGDNINKYAGELHPQDMSASFPVLEGDALNLLYCVLHFRRVETMFEGLRWFDIKRYGITVNHFYRGPMEDEIHLDKLMWNDPRRVLQIPNNVIAAGYPSTDRTYTAPDQSSSMTSAPLLAN